MLLNSCTAFTLIVIARQSKPFRIYIGPSHVSHHGYIFWYDIQYHLCSTKIQINHFSYHRHKVVPPKSQSTAGGGGII